MYIGEINIYEIKFTLFKLKHFSLGIKFHTFDARYSFRVRV